MSLQSRLDAESAISFITASVRIPTDWRSPLLVSEKLDGPRANPGDAADEGALSHDELLLRRDEQELWEIKAYQKLCAHLGGTGSQDTCLLSLEQVADRLKARFPRELKKARAPAPLVTADDTRRRGILDYHELYWLDSPYFPTSDGDSRKPTSTIVAFRPPGLPEAPPWREYLFVNDQPHAAERYPQLAAVYNVLGLLAQRRSLISVTAQRRLCKIVLPWGRCRFERKDGPSKEYLLVPVVTLLNRGGTAEFRRTITLTVFLLPDSKDPAPALDAPDLAALCQQAVWSDQSPVLPKLVAPGASDGPLFEGPLDSFVRPFLTEHDRHLPVVFDAILRRVIDVMGVSPTPRYAPESIRALVAISRARSVVFGSTLHVDADETPELWHQLTARQPGDLARHVGRLLSVNAARLGRERLVGGAGFRLKRMRVTNPYEEDTNTIILYNPMSRFMVNIMPRSLDQFPTVSLKLGVAWLNLLAATISSIKEIFRSYRYEIEQYRNRIENLGAGDPSKLLKDVHKLTLAMMTEIDVVYSFDIVTPTYKAAHIRILEMEGIAQERRSLMRELEMTTALLRSEEADQLSKKIADSTSSTEESARSTEESARSTDDLTKFVVVFTVISTIIGVNTIIDSAFSEPLATNHQLWTVLGVDMALLVVLTLCFIDYFRKRKIRRAPRPIEIIRPPR
jgi:hypothetical protein